MVCRKALGKEFALKAFAIAAETIKDMPQYPMTGGLS
jgi:hypothetical protein